MRVVIVNAYVTLTHGCFISKLCVAMRELEQNLHDLEKKILGAIEVADDLDALEEVRLAYLTRSGPVAQLLAQLKQLNDEQKKIYGPRLNELKKKVNERFDARKAELERQKYEQQQARKIHFDVTAGPIGQMHGSLHPYTLTQRQIENVLMSMGFAVVDGPELEHEWYNFDALNFASNHAARDLQDTLWLELPGLLMRTHTSPIQIHTMSERKPPLAIVASGRAFRYEATDATHDYVFNQTEVLVVDRHASLANLFATAHEFLKALFGTKKLVTRIRPSYFPFVEPGVEIDMQCIFCTDGCSACKGTRWIEIVGAGLVHPNVLRACKLDPEEYQGFAFGWGLTRLTMLRYGVNDIRLLTGANVDFLSQF